MLLIGKPSISMGHLYPWRTVSHNRRVYFTVYIWFGLGNQFVLYHINIKFMNYKYMATVYVVI